MADTDVKALCNEILAALDGQVRVWVGPADPLVQARNEGYNEGVRAALESAVRVLRAHGYDVQWGEDKGGEPTP